MTNQDSFSRILSYFHALAAEEFEHDGHIYKPYDALVITDAVFRSYTCPDTCGACCMKCSLLWDTDTNLDNVKYAPQTINNITVPFWVDVQNDNNRKDGKCKYLDETARCKIYPLRPLPCRFELFKFIHYVTKNKVYARVALPGRGWALTRIDGNKGNLCTITEYDRNATMAQAADLTIIARWMEQFKIKHNAHELIAYLLAGPTQEKFVISR